MDGAHEARGASAGGACGWGSWGERGISGCVSRDDSSAPGTLGAPPPPKHTHTHTHAKTHTHTFLPCPRPPRLRSKLDRKRTTLHKAELQAAVKEDLKTVGPGKRKMLGFGHESQGGP